MVWDGGNPVLTSSRRMDQGLLHTLVVSYGYHYALNLALNRLRPVPGDARRPRSGSSRPRAAGRLRRRWRAAVAALTVGAPG